MRPENFVFGDRTIPLLLEGYRFLPRRWRSQNSDVFDVRLLGERVICLHGPDAAEMFYDPYRFERSGATPLRVRKTLLGEGGVHGLDGAAHRERKQAFMRLMTPEQIDRLVGLVESSWREALASWVVRRRVVLFDEMQDVLCRAICAWASVPLPPGDVRRRASDMTAMIDGFGTVGPRHWRARNSRRHCEDWIGDLIDAVRAGRLDPRPGSALDVMARFRDADGQLLDRRVASVELLNVLRPTMAVAYFIVYIALALHERPQWSERLRAGRDRDAELFVAEVRRYVPFTPFLGARVRSTFTWHGRRFDAGTLVLLDVHGALHDDRVFADAARFDPDRFASWHDSGFELIPQGGGAHDRDHRCAGEWITIAVMKAACRLLTTAMDYDVPEQDLGLHAWRIPPKPESGFVIDNVIESAPVGGQK